MGLECTPWITLDESELDESFVRASGPGGQNVNKVSSAVQLRFDVRRSPSLPNAVAIRLMKLAGRRLTADGVLVITAQNHRTQERNRAEARERLVDLVREAAVPADPAPPRPADPGLEEAPAGGQGPPRRREEVAGRQARLRLTRTPPPRRSAAAAEIAVVLAAYGDFGICQNFKDLCLRGSFTLERPSFAAVSSCAAAPP